MRNWLMLATALMFAFASSSQSQNEEPTGKSMLVMTDNSHSAAATVQEKKKKGANKDKKGATPTLRLDTGGHSATVHKILFTKEGDRLVSVSADGSVRVWDTATGDAQSVLRLKSGQGRWAEMYAVALAPDGDTLAIAGFAGRGEMAVPKIRLLSLGQEEIKRTLTGHHLSIHALSFSKDGKWLASAGNEGLRLWNVATGSSTELKGHLNVVVDVAFSPTDANILLSASSDGVLLWDLAKKTSKAIEKSVNMSKLAWSKNGARFVTAGPGKAGAPPGVFVYEASGIFQKPLRIGVPNERGYETIGGVAFTPSETSVVLTAHDSSVSYVGRLPLDDAKDKERVYACQKNGDGATPRGPVAVAESRGALLVAAGDDADHRIFLWRSDQTGPTILGGVQRLVTGIGWIHPLPNQQRPRDPVLLLRAKPLGEEARNPDSAASRSFFDQGFGFGTLSMGDLSLSKRPTYGNLRVLDGYSLAREGDQFEVLREQKKTGVALRGPVVKNAVEYTMVGDKKVLVVAANRTVHLFDLVTGKNIGSYFQSGNSRGVATSPDVNGKRYLAVLGDDSIIRIYAPGEQWPLLYFTSAGNQWIAWTKGGYYAASAFGERLMGWQLNDRGEGLARFFPASEFRASLYRPDVIKLVLPTGNVKEALALADKARGTATQITDIEDVLPPHVKLLAPEASTIEIKGKTVAKIEIRAQAEATGKYPVTALRLLLNGRPYAGPGGLKTIAQPKLGAIQETWAIELEPGTYQVAVQAESAVSKARTELTRGIKRVDSGSGTGGTRAPKLNVLTVGVSAYQEPKLKLNFAHNDATKLADAFQQHAGKLFPGPKITTLTDKNATSTRFFEELETLRKNMTLHDIAVISFAGHGERDDKGRFYLLPVNVKPDKLADTAIPGEKFRDVLATIPGRIIVLLDACHSGGLETGPARRAAEASDDLLRRLVTAECGVIVMSSSTGAEFSLEGPQWQHGLFTKAVLEGLAGAADFNKDGYVSVKELDLYVSQRVEELSKGRQHPVTEVPLTFRSISLAQPR